GIALVSAELIAVIIRLVVINISLKIKLNIIGKSSLKLLISGLIMFFILSIISNYINNTYIYVILSIGFGALIYSGVLMLLRESTTLNIFNMLKFMINNKVKQWK